ncbi:hypothetical protein [Mesorhizobium sp. M1252]|uniref:hypothetical protein n=1 Tax=Mesorhizobium sp. M1252 TaxID=2957073 RepID=UPI0033354DF8
MNTEDIVRQAEAELAAEAHRDAVAEAKQRILRKRAVPLWQRLIPFTITIQRRTDNV